MVQQLEKDKPLKFDLLFLQDYKQYETCIFSNVQSLQKYYHLITADECFLSSTFIFFIELETWTLLIFQNRSSM
jgi:hypothetical protein